MSQYAYIVYETADPDQITRATGVEPSEIIRRSGKPSSWLINAEVAVEETQTENYIAAIMQKLKPAWEQFVALGRSLEPQVVCVVKLEPNRATPELGLSATMLQLISELHASFSVDLYNLCDDD